jgi:hypothetical protein
MPASNTYDTSNPGSAVSNREELANYITTLAPDKSPITALCSRGTTGATSFDWTVDTLDAPTSIGVEEGVDQENFADKFAGKARLSNNIVELRRAAAVTDWQEVANKAGAAGIAEAEVKCVKELKRDIEKNLGGTQNKATPDGLGTLTQSRGLDNWINSSGPSDVPAAYRTPAASIHASGTLTETIFKGIITSIFRQDGLDASLNLVADTALRGKVTGFAESTGSTNTTSRMVNQDANGKLVSTVSIYQSDHGIVTVRNMNPACAPDTTNFDTGYFIPDGMLVLREFIPMHSMMLPDMGGGKKVLVKWAGGLEVKHPAAFGKITTIN